MLHGLFLTIFFVKALLYYGSHVRISQLPFKIERSVVVLGFVSVPSGAFQSSYCYDRDCKHADCGFAIQDLTGPIWIAVSCSSINKYPSIQLNQKVMVTGTVHYQGNATAAQSILAVYPPPSSSAIKVLMKNNSIDIEPIHQSCREVNGTSQIVTVVGTVASGPRGDFSGLDPPQCKFSIDSPCFGYKYWLQGQGGAMLRVYFHLPPGTDFKNVNYAKGTKLRVTGFSGRYISPELNPRFSSDVRILRPNE